MKSAIFTATRWVASSTLLISLAACGGNEPTTDQAEAVDLLRTRYREAEWSAASNAFEMIDAAGASAGKVVRVKPGTRRNDDPNAAVGGAVGEMRFRFPAGNLSANRTQYLWIRYKAKNHGSNSLYIKGGGAYVRKDVAVGSGYQWLETGVSARSNASGVATFFVKNREAGLEIDRIYASDDANVGPGSTTPPPPASADHYREAESFSANGVWQNASSSGASGGRVLEVRAGTPRNDNANAGNSNNVTELRLDLAAGSLAANKTQHLWIRYKAAGYGADSFHIRGSGAYVTESVPIGNSFQWHKTGVTQRSNASGAASFFIKNRESTFELDRIFVTDDANANPGGGANPPPPPPPPPPVGNNGVRDFKIIGTKSWSRLVLDGPPRGWATVEWNKVIKRAFETYPCAFTEHYPSVSAKVRWSDAYVDSRIKPTPAQARNPNWSNYVWNQPERASNSFVYDGITDALNSSFIRNGNGPAKLMLLVGLTATSHINAPPVWMRNDPTLAWEGGSTTNTAQNANWHVRFDNPIAVQHAADFMEALLKKYGNNRGIAAVNLGEYFLGPRSGRPSNLSTAGYINGVADLWRKVGRAAPRDGNGDRVMLLQTQPSALNASVLSDLRAAGFGLAQSDAYLNLPVAGSASQPFLDAYNSGMHVAIDGDARYACIGRTFPWDGTPNPFGHAAGYRGVSTPQELFWYHGARGPVPVHSFVMSFSRICSPQTHANFLDAIRRFGRCGTEAGRWGPSPAD